MTNFNSFFSKKEKEKKITPIDPMLEQLSLTKIPRLLNKQFSKVFVNF